uniref:Uncharacterized protein n=1 Tax=Tetranychus urticae TaxID=32264 RepID=T1JT26_TETUR
MELQKFYICVFLVAIGLISVGAQSGLPDRVRNTTLRGTVNVGILQAVSGFGNGALGR